MTVDVEVVGFGFRESSSSKIFEVVYPYTQELVAQVKEANIEYVEHAVTAAKVAFPPGEIWLILESNNELVKLETLSAGRPISQFFDASFAAKFFGYTAGGGWTAAT
ncbi:Aldehyde/histidinol dehydrogenase [Penicillium cf. griseofulvum]|uniref:Aldehyde/histidinol dehydrogenase n=1 Tax=Penicillium cf. griseofulvum TaxID=2972120 RepID=A0A9W9M115_9EURO|nr:Aldehyde/histidinol dehydrogenase [Penicillium cf. griseofulvum]KAJ5429928.1 Aldehyde/histidinol dehydrogenase [Penicillium cf. griseofulvum]KAJ5436298.1 Aldehyde/histidinol dehydrogenase [Penicillium cf. griseofulvum]